MGGERAERKGMRTGAGGWAGIGGEVGNTWREPCAEKPADRRCFYAGRAGKERQRKPESWTEEYGRTWEGKEPLAFA